MTENKQAIEKKYTIEGHPLEFDKKKKPRTFDYYTTEPPGGVNDNTGIMLIIKPLAAAAESPYYTKLRKEWSARYNVVAITVNYIGGCFSEVEKYDVVINEVTKQMLYDCLSPEQKRQIPENSGYTVEQVMKLLEGQDLRHKIVISNNILSDEEKRKITNYNDFGYTETLDNLYALHHVINKYKKDQAIIDKRRIFALGSSMGGYLSQMCCRFAPMTFNKVIDLSGMVDIPDKYLFVHDNYLYMECKLLYNITVAIRQKRQYYSQDPRNEYYFSSDMRQLRSLVHTPNLVSFCKKSKTGIVMFHNADDRDVDVQDKMRLHKSYVKYGMDSTLHIFKQGDIDGEIIKSTSHADFNIKKLIEKYCDSFLLSSGSNKAQPSVYTDFDLKSKHIFRTSNGYYLLEYKNGYPLLDYHKN